MYCVADMLNATPVLELIWYIVIRPLGSEGGLHEMVSCTTPGVADRPDTGPGTVQEHTQ